MLFAFICQDKPGALQLRIDTRPAHIEFLDGLNAEGKLALAGPFLDADGKANGSFVVVKTETIEEARALSAADPYAKAGLFAHVEVRAWNWTYNKPEA